MSHPALIIASVSAILVVAASCELPAERELASRPAPAHQEREQQLPQVPAERLLPLQPQRRVFEIVAGDDRGDMVEMQMREARSGEPGDWVLDMDELNVLYLEEDDEGNVLVLRMDLPREGYRVDYQPPMRLIPSRIEPDLRLDESAQARVYDLASGELEHTGSVTHMIKSVTRSRFQTPSGVQDGYMVVMEHEIELGPANLSMEMEAGYLPGEGMVYRHLRYTILRLGLFGDTTRRTAVVVE